MINKKIFQLIILLLIPTININAQNNIEQTNEELELIGSIKTNNRTNYEISDCIVNSTMIMGVTSFTKSKKEASESSFVNGNYSYSYFVDDYSSQAGKISFNYSYLIKNGEINYRIYNFEHDGTDTEFASISHLTKSWNDEIGKIFTEKQYYEIMKDLLTNAANAIRMIKNYCLK